MKALQIVAPGDLRIVEMPMPALTADDQVLIKTHLVGICGSDMHIMDGSNPFVTYPRVFGHEMVGEVVETGQAVTHLKAGDHVVLEPITYCGQCYACTHGQPNVCESLQVNGVHVDGAAAEYMVANGAAVHKVDAQVPLTTAVLAEPLTIGSQSCERGRVVAGDIVLISGAGTIGLCVLMNAKLRGATCIITDVVQDKLDYALSIGADYAVNVAKEDMQQAVVRLVGDQKVNVFIDAVGLVRSVEQALELISPAGRIVCLGFGTEPARLPFVHITKKQVEVVGSRLQTKQFPRVIRWMEEGRFPLEGFVSRVFPLDKVHDAFKYASEHAGEYRKLLVQMST